MHRDFSCVYNQFQKSNNPNVRCLTHLVIQDRFSWKSSVLSTRVSFRGSHLRLRQVCWDFVISWSLISEPAKYDSGRVSLSWCKGFNVRTQPRGLWWTHNVGDPLTMEDFRKALRRVSLFLDLTSNLEEMRLCARVCGFGKCVLRSLRVGVRNLGKFQTGFSCSSFFHKLYFLYVWLSLKIV